MDNPKFFFSYAKRFSKLRSNIGPLKDENGNLKHEPEDMANILQSQYSSVFSNPQSDEIDPVAYNTIENTDTCITDIEINRELMMEAMNELDSNSSAPDGDIPARVLKK